MVHLILYKSNGLSLSAPYIQIVNVKHNEVWDFTNGEFTDTPSSYADTTSELDPKGDSSGDPSALYGGWPVTLPRIGDGEFDLIVKDNSTPANTDLIKTGKRFAIRGEQLIAPTKLPFIDF
jgi:hypothetical protein